MTAPAPSLEDLRAHVAQARWFGGKGRPFEVTGSRTLTLDAAGALPEPRPGTPTVTVALVQVRYSDTSDAESATETYQLPLSSYAEEQPQLAHAYVGRAAGDPGGEQWVYDALHDHAATPLWLAAFAAGGPHGDVTFHKVADHDLDSDARSTLFSGQQSNSSVAYGEDSLMKVFRRLTPGENPDVEVLRVLTEAGNEHVAALYGYMAASLDGEPYHLGILQQFLRTASDGWDLALASLRTLFADSEVSARESGGDFAAEAHRLGVAVAEMHEALAAGFPTESWGPDELARLADAMTARLRAAQASVPELDEVADALEARFDAVRRHPGPVLAQRVHGDLHLGQTLRTVRTWKIIDFEGEPAKPLAERRRPDSPWRDVAGMLRSFDYASEISRRDHAQATGDADDHDAVRAREWAERNLTAFLAGYRDASGSEIDSALLTAYAADKAVYEVMYEARNRPDWLAIPLAAVARIAREPEA